ncbi:MAG TPA: hypothetical protein VLE43_13385 [Candidatus Saccharimonadia bacterium]|nr:hypothetical protein [Candidatus Saccharimonadia bacterium]
MKTISLCALALLTVGAFGHAAPPESDSATRDGEEVRKPEAVRQELAQKVQNRRRSQNNPTREARIQANALQARHLITVANDYIVEVYKNGKRIPDAQRELLEERFGATVERITVDVRKGDWLVFNVVHNRIRWGGSKYFAVAGRIDDTKIGFVSDPASQQWSVCDDPAKSAEFIRNRDAGIEVRAGAIANPWGEGDGYIRKFAGEGFSGKSLWGGAPSTWIKFVAGDAAPVVSSQPPAPPVIEGFSGSGEGDVSLERITIPIIDPRVPPVPAAPPAPKTYKPKRWPVQILSAIYGTGGKDADVTGKVREHVETEQRMFAVDPPNLGADPNPYWNKSLHIVYMKDGVRREQWRGENEHVLPESFYGPQDAVELGKWLHGSRWFGEQPEIQFHADNTFTSPGVNGTHRWETTANNKLRLIWVDDRKAEFTFDYTWSSFSKDGDASQVYHMKK